MALNNRKLTSVKNLCADGNTPYYELCYDETHSRIVRKTLEGSETWNIQTPYIYCGLVEDVRIFGRSFIESKDGAFVFHCQSYQNHLSAGFDACAASLLSGPDAEFYIEDECVFLGGMWTEPTPAGPSHLHIAPNFGHFIFEYLNRLAIFEFYNLSPRLPIVVYDNLPERWLGFLEIIGISRDRIIRVPIANPPKFRKVWVSSACHYRDSAGVFRVWGAGFHWLRFKVLSGLGGLTVAPRRRIYLGRDGATWRKVANESALRAMLAEYDFEFPDMNSLPANEQLTVISQAELVVVSAGAGAVLTHFAPEHCMIILLAPASVAEGLWGGLASAIFLRQVYDRLDCEHVASEQHRVNSWGVNELSDFRVDLPKLRHKIRIALGLISAGQHRDALKL